ncbi:hypothetical protein BDW22DRAFT_1424935 [Trametopsis cervina]|nr:hypothetical protein BDW22DRAFT_1424935 [Trametopsis cervina]
MRYTTAICTTLITFGANTLAQSVPACTGPSVPVTPLYAAYGTSKIGPVTVQDNGTVTLAPSSGLVTRFYLNDTILCADIPSLPRAYISFENTPTCGPVGPFLFSTTNSNKCASDNAFDFSGNTLVYSKPGSFQLCGSGSAQFIVYSTNPSALPAACTNINLLQA